MLLHSENVTVYSPEPFGYGEFGVLVWLGVCYNCTVNIYSLLSWTLLVPDCVYWIVRSLGTLPACDLIN